MLIDLANIALTVAFFGSIWLVSYALSSRWLSNSPPTIRLVASFVIFSWSLSIGFSLLISLGLFKPIPALCFGLFAIISARLFLWPNEGLFLPLYRDFTSARNALAQISQGLAGWTVIGFFLLLSALFFARGLSLPLLGWDTLTYHALKAGLWVQTGGWHTLDAPGGWEYYRSFFGGGEVFTAWSMLFTHSDLLSAMPDIASWLLLGLISFCLLRQFGVSQRPSFFVSIALICCPPLSEMVGSGYVEITAYSFLLCGFLFLMRADQSENTYDFYLAAAALGIASSIKINIFAIALLLTLPALIVIYVRGKRNYVTYLISILLFAAPVAPWLLHNLMTTGYPLGSTAFNIGPIVLGKAPANLEWFLDRPEITPYVYDVELDAFNRSIIHFGPALLLALLGLAGVITSIIKRRLAHIVGLWFIVACIALYLFPSFSVIRLVWADWNARFLALIVILPSIMGLSLFTQFKRGQRTVEAVSILCIATSIYGYFESFFLNGQSIEVTLIYVSIIAVLLIYFLLSTPFSYRLITKPTCIVIICILCMVGVAAIGQFRNSVRTIAYSECTTLHTFPRYWAPALEVLDAEQTPVTIAFAYGPEQISHGAYLAPFFGARLENQLLYISPDKGGVVPAYSKNYFMEIREPDFEMWLDALVEQKATHLLCFLPAPIELLWAENNPRLFTRLVGNSKQWGLFEVHIET
ncbi:MAG: hypothetical protein P9L94_20575 [Candidatus Hinthialibacter antarcticus]|nr:hypothetical protein [Candidatus Hinthialibacter antarcticus]